jgi:hypothetical protein
MAPVSYVPDVAGEKWRLARVIVCILGRAFHAQKRTPKRLNPLCLRDLYRRINSLRWSDPLPRSSYSLPAMV